MSRFSMDERDIEQVGKARASFLQPFFHNGRVCIQVLAINRDGLASWIAGKLVHLAIPRLTGHG